MAGNTDLVRVGAANTAGDSAHDSAHLTTKVHQATVDAVVLIIR